MICIVCICCGGAHTIYVYVFGFLLWMICDGKNAILTNDFIDRSQFALFLFCFFFLLFVKKQPHNSVWRSVSQHMVLYTHEQCDHVERKTKYCCCFAVCCTLMTAFVTTSDAFNLTLGNNDLIWIDFIDSILLLGFFTFFCLAKH